MRYACSHKGCLFNYFFRKTAVTVYLIHTQPILFGELKYILPNVKLKQKLIRGKITLCSKGSEKKFGSLVAGCWYSCDLCIKQTLGRWNLRIIFFASLTRTQRAALGFNISDKQRKHDIFVSNTLAAQLEAIVLCIQASCKGSILPGNAEGPSGNPSQRTPFHQLAPSLSKAATLRRICQPSLCVCVDVACVCLPNIHNSKLSGFIWIPICIFKTSSTFDKIATELYTQRQATECIQQWWNLNKLYASY